MTLDINAALAATEQPDARRPRQNHPKGFEPGVKFSIDSQLPESAVICSDNELEAEDHRAKIEEQTNLKIPAHLDVRIERLTLQSGPDGGQRWWYKYVFVTRSADVLSEHDFASLVTLARKTRRKPRTPKETPQRAIVVGYADPQTGKVASRGGTPELLARVQASLGLLEDYCDEFKSDAAYLLDAGDAIEGFENTSAQGFTNDLSLPRQVEIASDILFEFTDLLARKHDRVVVAGVGSNHCRWRAGKGALGLPGDDWGIHMHRQLAKALKLNPAYDHVSVTWPNEHEETLALNICGTIVGLAHGHQAKRPEGIPAWWANQVHGGQTIGHAELLITGHFHSFRTQSTGRDPFKKREKRWFQCPTLDNGSDWYRTIAGDDSDTGLMVFTVDANGWDNLRVLRPDAQIL